MATFCNLSTIVPGTLTKQVADIYLARELRAETPAARVASEDPAASAAAPAGATTATIPAAQMAELAGEYRSDELETTWRIAIDGDRLMVTGGGARRALRLVSPDRFSAGSQNLRIQRDAGGRVTGFLLDAGRVRNLKFERKRAER